MKVDELLDALPGERLIRDGIADLLHERRTIPALLVSIARVRLTRAQLLPASAPRLSQQPELDLYRELRQEPGDPYARYNALLRELVSFAAALDHRRRRRLDTVL